MSPPSTGGASRTRVLAAIAAVVTVAAGLAIRSLMAGDAGKYAGDALYTVLVYALIVVAAPRSRPMTVAWVALAVSWAIEFLQLTTIPASLSARSGQRLVLGSTFNPPDLFWYAVGAAFAWLVHATARARRTDRRSRRMGA